MSKSEIKTNWDLSLLLPNEDPKTIEGYRAEVKKATEVFVDKWKNRNDYLEDPAVLKEALDELETWDRLPGMGNEYFYYGLRTSVDSINPELKARENQAVEFIKTIINELQFFWIRVGGIDESKQSEFLEFEGLQPYRHWLEVQFREAKHRLSEAEEKILTLKSTPAHSLWVQMTSDFLSKDERETIDEQGRKIKATEEQLFSLMGSQDKKVRDTAAKVFNEMISDYKEVAVAEFNAIMANKKIDDSLRGYDRADAARHSSDDIDTEVVDALIEAVTDNFGIAHRFYQLRANLFKMPHLMYHERIIEYGDVKQEYPYDKASQLVEEVFRDLDPEFAEIYTSFLENGQIDAFPKKGKRGGAFCAGQGLQHPTYVLLNHTDKLRDVMTIAHEMGHAINNEMIRKSQNALNFGTPMATAEVASTFMEDFVVERLLKDADEEMELVLRIRQLDDAIATIFRQIAFYKFEQDLHLEFRKAGYVPEEKIGDIFRKNVDAYLGPVFQGSHDAKNWWIYIPHFRTFFYVYSYASGLLISKAMQGKVRADKNFIKEVKQFLSAGLSKSPKDIFADMDIDITDKNFWAAGLKEVDQMVAETEALARKLGKIK